MHPIKWLAAALTATTLTLTLLVTGQAKASLAPVRMDGKVWLVKDNDLAAIGGIGAYQWTGCGLGTGPPYASTYAPCHAGQDPIYASYWKFAAAVQDGRQARGSAVIFDDEVWSWTPKPEQEHQWKYERLAGLLARKHGITIVITPYASTNAGEIADEVAAAPYASVVDIQSQRNAT